MKDTSKKATDETVCEESTSSKLNRLCLTGCSNIMDCGLINALKRLPHLETLELSYMSIRAEDINVIGQSCPQLKSFTMKKEFMDTDGDVHAIADSMPKLRHLKLVDSTMDADDGIQAILNGFPRLESVDLRCSQLHLDGNLEKLCRERIKDFKYTILEGYDDSEMEFAIYDMNLYVGREMPHEIMGAMILQWLDAVEILSGAQKICITWRMTCKDPAKWKIIDLDFSSSVCIRRTILRNCYNAQKLKGIFFVNLYVEVKRKGFIEEILRFHIRRTSAVEPSLAMEGRRDWLQMPDEIMGGMILQRLGAIDILMNAQKVCRNWRRICKDPVMWKIIDMDYSSCRVWYTKKDYENLIKQAVHRSCGELIHIRLNYHVTKDLLDFISRRSTKLKSLCLMRCYNITDYGLNNAVKRLPHLETLELSYISIGVEDIEVIGHNCPQLKSFTMKEGLGGVYGFTMKKGFGGVYGHAHAIANSMHALCHLKLFGTMGDDDEIQAILNGCPHHESLHMRFSFSALDRKLEILCKEQIKDFKFKRNMELAPEKNKSSMASESRNWMEMPDEIMGGMTLQRLDAVQILMSVQKVCRNWWRICKDPAMWKIIVMEQCYNVRYGDEYKRLCKQAIYRSFGELALYPSGGRGKIRGHAYIHPGEQLNW
ncbi:hypothetical protein OSB04_001978 [Centaurea solstitialis]|uniref:F-box domain-containing protein n=1 Tax=Centaurea solstitialis TaxID=347529 RepID=A0AA38WLX3_9ASTR|nr:hypothetical protein OSB04_001978 [Centaurea solstitialis]